MEVTTLRRRDDGQGLIVPKADSEHGGVATGDGMETRIGALSGGVVSRPATGDRRYRRERRVSATELLEGWGGGLRASLGPEVGRGDCLWPRGWLGDLRWQRDAVAMPCGWGEAICVDHEPRRER